MNILNIEHVSKLYGDKWIFDDISCGIQEGEKVGIIGINGTARRPCFGLSQVPRRLIRGRSLCKMA